MKAVIARISPITNSPVIFDVSSRQPDGRIKAFLEGKDVEVGYDFYMNTEHLPKEQALELAKAYAKHAKIPEHEILVRQRFPKSNPGKPRKTNDAALQLVEKEEKGETLQELAQDLHDKHTKQAKEQPASKKEEKRDEAVKPVDAAKSEEGKKRRAYNKSENKRSAAAMKRYLAELGQVAAESPTLLEPVAHTATPAQYDAAVMELATAIAKILKSSGNL